MKTDSGYKLTVNHLVEQLKKESERLGVDLMNTPLSSIGTMQVHNANGPSEFGYMFHFIKGKMPIDIALTTVEIDQGIESIEEEPEL